MSDPDNRLDATRGYEDDYQARCEDDEDDERAEEESHAVAG